jgi:hypothetical protein
VFTNLDHGFGGGHGATHAFLSGVRSAEAARFWTRSTNRPRQ